MTHTPNDAKTKTTSLNPTAVRSAVRDIYGAIATNFPAGSDVPAADATAAAATISASLAAKATATAPSCCAPTCCDPVDEAAITTGPATSPSPSTQAVPACGPAAGDTAAYTELLGYSTGELASLPAGADIGLGCGNPQAIASLETGETVVDLGSGAGIDCFLAAKKVGSSGRVIGVDMTHAMLERARALAASEATDNVEFRLGEIEHLPVADATVDVVMSNCVVNLSPDPAQVFAEVGRVLRPGGRVAIYDVVALQPLPEALRTSIAAIAGCMGQASSVAAIEGFLRDAGLVDIEVAVSEASRKAIAQWMPGSGAENFVSSAAITARKPLANSSSTSTTRTSA